MSANEEDEALIQKLVDEIICEREAIQRIYVNKKSHRIRFENETEDEVTIVIENRKQETSD